MTREIKFRAWNRNTKSMISHREFLEEVVENNGCFNIDNYESMQYTGLKYQNGKKIFEGDIVEVTNAGLFKVFFENGTFLIKALGYNMPLYQYIPEFVCGVPLYQYIYQCKFIGNIYENPELLGGKYE